MHLTLLAAVVLAQVPLPVPYPGGAQDDYQSPIVSLIAWDKGGSADWGAGIPSPTIDCAATGTSSSASLQCSGATPSFAGPGQVAAGSPWWYRNDTAVRPAIALNGSTDYWDLGDVDLLGDWTACALVSAAGTGNGVVVGKFKTAAYQWAIRAVGGSYAAVAWNAAGDGSALTLGTIVPGTWTVLCASYVRSTQALIGTMNGTASGPVTSGATENVTTALRIGNGETAALWPGGVHRVAIWDGTALTAAQLAQMVATQWGLAADKPAGTVATHARTDSTPCGPFSDSELYWLGPGAPCIHAPTYQGWASGGAVAGGVEVYGTTSNLALNSASLEAATWLKTAGAVVANASASCPRAPDGSAAMHLITAAGTGDGVYNSLAGGNGVAQTFSAWVALATGDSACPITMLDSWGGAATVTQTLSATPRRISVGQTGARDEFGVFFLRGSGGCARWCVWGPQVTKTATVQPYRSTTGTAYSGLASTATTLTVPVALTDPARWAIGVTASLGTWSAQRQFLFALGSGANAASLDVYSDAKIYGYIYDAASGGRTITGGAHGFGAGSTHTVMMGQRGVPDATIWFDGVATASTAVGAGTGIMSSMPATLTVGSTGSALHIGGIVSRVAQCKRASGCR